MVTEGDGDVKVILKNVTVMLWWGAGHCLRSLGFMWVLKVKLKFHMFLNEFHGFLEGLVPEGPA